MPKLAILIPSRNERYLYPTIRDCFAKAAGEVEVVVHLDGYWPADWRTMTDTYPNLHTIHSGEPCGMRPGLNKAAGSAIQRGAKWLFKLDAHCMLDEGYDQKLLADIEPNWIVVPRRKRLDAEKWELQDVGKPDIDYHYLSFPNDANDWGGAGLNGRPWTQRTLERRDKPEYDIDDELSSQGSAWCMAASYFTELELMDTESYGPFWNEAQELFLKCWLSGGRGVVNKKTWYAHLRKGKEYEGADGKKGRGYTLPESWLQTGRNHTLNWIYNDAWPKQTLPFEWLIDHFWPVPSWPENWREVLYAKRKPRAIIGAFKKFDSDFPRFIGTGTGVVGNELYKVKIEPLTETGLKIISARYGLLSPTETETVDVTERVQSLVKDGSLDIVVNNSTLNTGNVFRGKRKRLWVTYSIDGGEPITVEREEKDWLIIGPVGERGHVHDFRQIEGQSSLECGCGAVPRYEADDELRLASPVPVADITQSINEMLEVQREGIKQGPLVAKTVLLADPPRTAPALNDYLIRKFSISPQRLRGPMPIELRDFHRNDLAQLFAELGFKRGAEIGVAEGNYSEILLKANPECELLLVDLWHAYSDNPQNKSKEKNEFAYNETLRKIKPYSNAVPVMETSMEYVRNVVDKSLDFCYIDGNHLFDYVIQDLVEWSKRVRSGGIVSGDDYYALDQKRWVGGGVVEAVQAYTNAHRIPIWYLFVGHKSVDFMWVKP